MAALVQTASTNPNPPMVSIRCPASSQSFLKLGQHWDVLRISDIFCQSLEYVQAMRVTNIHQRFARRRDQLRTFGSHSIFQCSGDDDESIRITLANCSKNPDCCHSNRRQISLSYVLGR